ncbi:hypothetical protein C9974_13240 [Marinobacter sp. B9-2]|nr:hypothetical protein C9974_13240 [Marinobacter sp. B9-2]
MSMKSEDRLVFRLKGRFGYVDGSWFSDADLASVPADTVFLNLENSGVSDFGIASLPEMPALRCIDLDGTRVTDAAMERLATFKSLEEIWLESTVVSDSGLGFLQSLKGLKFISVLDCEHISNEAISSLQAANPGIEVH